MLLCRVSLVALLGTAEPACPVSPTAITFPITAEAGPNRLSYPDYCQLVLGQLEFL
jgi:hypothetical protein